MKISSESLISEVVKLNFKTALIFQANKIGYCCGGDKTISVACGEVGINRDHLIKICFVIFTWKSIFCSQKRSELKPAAHIGSRTGNNLRLIIGMDASVTVLPVNGEIQDQNLSVTTAFNANIVTSMCSTVETVKNKKLNLQNLSQCLQKQQNMPSGLWFTSISRTRQEKGRGSRKSH